MDSIIATHSERDKLLRRYWKATERFDQLMDEGKYESVEQCLEASRSAEQEYFHRLPRPALSCCPVCGKPLYRSFDPYGLDGLWWKPSASPPEPPSCPHFCVLVGAVGYQGKDRRAGKFAVRPGPEVPYVIPRLLEHPGMIAVIGEVTMAPGYLAWPIAYFAESRPAVEDLTAGWAREAFNYLTPLGETGMKYCNDPWDFELLPWAERGKIQGCEPGSGNARLSKSTGADCPYLHHAVS